MPIKTNLKDLAPSSERFKKEIALLSRGYSAPNQFPGGKVVIYPWDTEVSAWLASDRALQPGRLLYALTGKLTGFTDEQVQKFVAGEITLVLLVARAVANEQQINYTAKCPVCGTLERCSVVVPDNLAKVGEKPDKYIGWDEVTLPDCKDVLKIRPLLVADEIAVTERPRLVNDISDTGARLITSIISVNGGTPDSIDERKQYYLALSPKDRQFFTSEVDRLTPHLDTRIQQKCPNCKSEFTHELTFDEEFFRPSGSKR
jgi:hypothetical protein